MLGPRRDPPSSTIFDEPHYALSRQRRLANLFAHVDPGPLEGASVLETGCGTGDLGETFVRLGCHVVSVDAVPDHIAALRRRYPARDARVLDLDALEPGMVGRFDLILCFGLLYHLSRPAAFLDACSAISDRIFLETVVLDAHEARCDAVRESGADQSHAGLGCRPSPAWLERELVARAYEVQDVSSPRANWGGPVPSCYDWIPRGDGAWERDGTRLRRMYVCTRRAVMPA